MSSGPSLVANTVSLEFSDQEAGEGGTREDRAQGAGKEYNSEPQHRGVPDSGLEGAGEGVTGRGKSESISGK